ncbi:hypothetical protein, secreted [gut metagenome]|uniref:DUF4251 domain-containing protein n=1 Tax=gut metagenome TaxID=749906 RepID=J9GI96_9ZZZZ
MKTKKRISMLNETFLQKRIFMRKNVFLLLLALLLGMITPLSAQNRKEKKKQKKEAVEQSIRSGHYKIDVQTALPMSGPSIPLNARFSLEIRNDSVCSDLPYFGRAYSIPYGGGDGLQFSAPMQNYTMKIDKKGTADIRFTVRNTEDQYEFSAKIYSNGSTSIQVNMQRRQSINFHGQLDTDKP